MTSYWLEHAWVEGAVRSGVRVEVHDETVTAVITDAAVGSAERLPGLTIPGLANAHSHAFHRALRGRTQRGPGTFWTWRTQMYALAAVLDPDSYRELALAVYREMLAAGYTSVGEFHYLHHDRDGGAYDDANVMGKGLVAAADEAGIRITLLDTCYLAAGIGKEPEGVQRRFSDGSADRWLARVDGTSFGSAIHSVRAVPRQEMPVVAARGGPLHVHLSEQTVENDECLAAYGLTPTQLLSEAGAVTDRTCAVHATHLTAEDIGLLGSARAFVCFCPTTERDLGDGIGPSLSLAEAGCRLNLGSDSHAVVDPFEEMRALELDERLRTRTRGNWAAADVLSAASVNGQASLGFDDAGAIAVGMRADLVSIDVHTTRTAGTGGDEHTVVYAASAADVLSVVVGGRRVDLDRKQVAADLDTAIRRLWERV